MHTRVTDSGGLLPVRILNNGVKFEVMSVKTYNTYIKTLWENHLNVLYIFIQNGVKFEVLSCFFLNNDTVTLFSGDSLSQFCFPLNHYWSLT